MTEEKREFKGIWIPSDLYLNKDLSWGAKIVWLEINSLTGKDRDCYFSNEYLAKFIGCSERQIKRYLADLVRADLIDSWKEDGKRFLRSRSVEGTKMSLSRGQGRPSVGDKNGLHNSINIPYQINTSDSKESDLPDNSFRERKPKLNKKKEADPCYPAFVKLWTEAQPTLGFDSVSGKKIKEMIVESRKIVIERNSLYTGLSEDERAKGIFLYILDYARRTNHWAWGKSITTFASKYREIYTEIVHGKQKPSGKKQSPREFLNNLSAGR